jgi:hypothetical protein
VDAYLAAKNGSNPRSYASFTQLLGDPKVAYNSTFYSLFVQDDLRLSASFKVLFGVRYDLFQIPDSRPFAANPRSAKFKVDKNNFAPRIGFSWAIDPQSKTVLRASTGIMYEPPLINFYEDAIQRNGDPRTISLSLSPTSVGAPAFPGTLANLPSGFTLPTQSIVAIDRDFSTQYTILSNVQLEREVIRDLAIAVGYVNSVGRNLPVLVDVNPVPTGATLADGRPIYSTAVTSATRVDPTFNHVDVFQSVGKATYNAFTLTMTKRMSHGFSAEAAYTFARGTDDAPLTGTYVVGSQDDRLSDPSNRSRDKGVTPFNQTHTFSLAALIAPHASGGGLSGLLNNNQLGFILQANSGLPFNIRSNRDLNLDGVATNDRPIGIDRNTGRLGRVFNLDARYSRFVPFGRVRGELFAEAKNLFNTQNTAGVNRVVAVDAAGNPLTPLPDPFPPTSGYLQRHIQLGLKVNF